MPKPLWVKDDRKGFLLFLTSLSLGKERILLNIRGNQNRQSSLTIAINMLHRSTLFHVNWFAIDMGSGNNSGKSSWKTPFESSTSEKVVCRKEDRERWGKNCQRNTKDQSVRKYKAPMLCSPLNSWFLVVAGEWICGSSGLVFSNINGGCII